MQSSHLSKNNHGNDLIEIPHRCVAVVDLFPISDRKLYCVVCGKEIHKRIYPKNARYFAESSLADLV
jgi:hypothetical protein